MRLFIAINFNEDVIDDLVRRQEELKRCRVAGNFTWLESLLHVRETVATAASLMRSERGKRGMIYTEIGDIDGDGKH